MKYYLIAGEASGDLHGSNLIKELHKLDAAAEIRSWGGDLMAAAGATVVKHYRDLAFMGFAEVIKNLPTILKNINFCKQDVAAFAPDVLVLIDYPGFNLRIAEWAKTQGLKTVYYISPQVWAWKESRVKKIKAVVDKMLVILPFEKTFFEDKWNYKVEYVGHPLVRVIDKAKAGAQPLQLASGKLDSNKKTIALLPGSRTQEIRVKLPIMLKAAQEFPHYQFVIAIAPGQPLSFYQSFLSTYKNILLTQPGQTYNLLSTAWAALVTSGTATLETALFGVPQVVCYKGSAISYQIAKRIITIKYISLVNLIMDAPVVTELIQHQLTAQNITTALEKICSEGEERRQMLQQYEQLKKLLAAGGDASAKAAGAVYTNAVQQA